MHFQKTPLQKTIKKIFFLKIDKVKNRSFYPIPLIPIIAMRFQSLQAQASQNATQSSKWIGWITGGSCCASCILSNAKQSANDGQ